MEGGADRENGRKEHGKDGGLEGRRGRGIGKTEERGWGRKEGGWRIGRREAGGCKGGRIGKSREEDGGGRKVDRR